MIARPSLVLSIVITSLAWAWAGPALASERDSGPTRADVKAAVIEARADGELMPAGERSFVVATGRGTGVRADVKAAVLQAIAHGELLQPGDRPMPFAAAQSLRARSDVKGEVMQAKAGSGLTPAGERLSLFEPASYPARAYRPRIEMTASSRR
ncbi:DUF4148 domain-containing protein [Ramlibacter sp.]|uniref:DUF4148 domain-containing protein n=1 Tax=Ramlibacter sp. TaxID=1917967 RepID=UPI0017AAE728|nr:DUF4148 domain-containing protein [Ramlibacter sp.]MBA2673318.1 hypothetical protein [Ramlibacter sp.]